VSWIDLGKRRSIHAIANTWIRLSEELTNFENYIAPTDHERSRREEAMKTVKSTILEIWPKVQVETYGSVVTGLELPSR
jgi:DNA polymerase sigma